MQLFWLPASATSNPKEFVLIPVPILKEFILKFEVTRGTPPTTLYTFQVRPLNKFIQVQEDTTILNKQLVPVPQEKLSNKSTRKNKFLALEGKK